MGEHAAVYGQPALVAAVDPRAHVEVAIAAEGLEVDLLDLGKTLHTTWEKARAEAERSRRAWQEYVAEPSPSRFAEVGSGSPESLALLSLGELATELEDRYLPPLRMQVRSNLPIGSGFGSSAAIAVAMIGAIQAAVSGEFGFDAIDAMALEVERRQHGLPSGVDHKTVLYGGVVMAVRDSAGGLEISRLKQTSPILEQLQVYQTGRPSETTGEVVATVRRRRDEDRDRLDRLFERMGQDVLSYRDVLVGDQDGTETVCELIRDYQRCLEELDVVPSQVRETIREVEARGGSAKISGAGTLTGHSAGCLQVFWPEGPPAELPAGFRDYQLQPVVLGVEGLRMEEQQ